MDEPERILIFNVNWIGDAIFSVPVFRAVKEAYPNAKVVCAGLPRIRPIMDSCRYVDEFFCYDEQGEHRTIWGKIRFIQSLRRGRFDVAFLLHGSQTRAWLTFLAGIKRRIGYPTKKRKWLLTDPIALPQGKKHRSDYYLHVVEASGIPVRDRAYHLQPHEAANISIRAKLKQAGIPAGQKYIIMNAGGNWALKRWPVENFVRLVDRLWDEFRQPVVIPGSHHDVELAETIRRKAGHPPVILAGRTDIQELLSLMASAELAISNDTGPLHLAAAAGTDVVALFGPTRPEITGPRGTAQAVLLQEAVGCNATPCYHLSCPDNVCMKQITVEKVIDAVRTVKNKKHSCHQSQ